MGWFTTEKPKTGWEIVGDVISKGDFSTTKEVFSPLKALGTVASGGSAAIVTALGVANSINQSTSAGISSQMDTIDKKLGK